MRKIKSRRRTDAPAPTPDVMLMNRLNEIAMA